MQDLKVESKVVKAATWYSISNILLRGISIFTAPIFTRLLSTSDYGIASNFVSWVSIVSCITGLGLGTSVIRGKIEFKEDFKKYLSSVQFLGIIATLFVIIIMVPSLSFWSNLMELDKWLIVGMLLYLLVFPSVSYTQIAYRFEYRYKENIIITIINTLGNVACSIGLILMFGSQRYVGRIIGTILPIFLMGIVFCFKIHQEGRCFFVQKYWKYALNISLPMIPHALSMIILGQIDRAMILKYCGSSDAGIYSFGYSYGILLAVVTNAINDAIQPMTYEYINQDNYKKVNDLFQKVMNLVVFLVILVIAVGPEALMILGTREYYDGRWIVFPVVLGTMFQFFYQNVACVEIYHKKTKLIAIGSVGAALVNFVLNMVFIPKVGYLAAGYTTMISYFLLFLYHYLCAQWVAGKKIFHTKSFVLNSMTAIVFSTILFGLYDIWYIRYIMLSVVMIWAIMKNKNDLLYFWRLLKKRNIA